MSDFIEYCDHLEVERDKLKEKSNDDIEQMINLARDLTLKISEIQIIKDAVKELLKRFHDQIHAMDNVGKNPPDKLLQKIFSNLGQGSLHCS